MFGLIKTLVSTAAIVILTVSVAESRTLNYATPSAPDPDRPTNKVLQWWIDEVAQRTDGSVEIQIHWLQSLLKYKDAATGVSSGLADIAPMTPEYTQARLPLWTLSGTESGPGEEYVASEAWRRVREASPALQEEEARNNMKYLGHYSSGARILLSAARPYLTPADFRGDKVRLPARSVQAAEFANWPVTTVSLPITDVYSAMERGTIDGSQGYLNFIFPYKQHEVAKHVVETGLGQSMVVMMMNRDVWESLSDEEQQVFTELLPEFNLRMARTGIEQSGATRKKLEKHPEYPTEVHQLNEQQRELWDTGLRQAEEKYVARATERAPAAAEIYRKYTEELAKVEREVKEDGYPWDNR